MAVFVCCFFLSFFLTHNDVAQTTGSANASARVPWNPTLRTKTEECLGITKLHCICFVNPRLSAVKLTEIKALVLRFYCPVRVYEWVSKFTFTLWGKPDLRTSVTGTKLRSTKIFVYLFPDLFGNTDTSIQCISSVCIRIWHSTGGEVLYFRKRLTLKHWTRSHLRQSINRIWKTPRNLHIF